MHLCSRKTVGHLWIAVESQAIMCSIPLVMIIYQQVFQKIHTISVNILDCCKNYFAQTSTSITCSLFHNLFNFQKVIAHTPKHRLKAGIHYANINLQKKNISLILPFLKRKFIKNDHLFTLVTHKRRHFQECTGDKCIIER